MLKAKQELAKHIETKLIKLIADTERCNQIANYTKDTYEIPRTIVLDLLSMRNSLLNASDFVLFCLMEGIEKVTEQNKTEIDKFFTMQEFKNYRNSKYEVDKIKFPLRFSVNPVPMSDGQWIGVIDTKVLMKLRSAQMINYNVNAQRTMQKIVKGGKELYKIMINQSAVDSIAELFKKGIYIPTPFTLNIPLDSEADFYYDDEKKELVIKSLDNFDILDGYHRYVAACKVSDEDENFNYGMELRIVNWNDVKAQTFVWQENQKTKMKKIDSDSLNMNKAANIVTTRINENPMCNIQGLISRNKGIINFGDLSELINYFYFKGISKEKEKSAIINAVKEITDNFNMLTEYDSVYLEREYSYRQLTAIMFLFNYFKDKDKKHMLQITNDVISKVEKLDNQKFYSKVPKKSIMNDIESIVKECE